VTDPRTRESRGFAFVTMETVEDANRCVKYLNRSVLEGRVITVEKVLFPSMDFEGKHVGTELFTCHFFFLSYFFRKCYLISFASRSGICNFIDFTV